MPALADMMLAAGAASNVEAVHGERIVILTGEFAPRIVPGVVETMSDQTLDGILNPGGDPRAKVVLHFRRELKLHTDRKFTIQTEDGRQWRAVRSQESSFLTDDYELTEIVPGKDT